MEKLASLDREEFLKRVISLQFDRFLNDYRYGEELVSPASERDEGFRGKGRKDSLKSYSGNYTRLFINLGKTDGFYPEQLISLVNKNTTGPKVILGKIDLMKTFSFFEVEADHSDEIINALNNARFNDRKVAVEVAQPKSGDHDYSERKEKRHAKWSDRKPDRKSDKKKGGDGGKRSDRFKKDKKAQKKNRW
jgi:ATP-dependent RNA helicase DeaD